MKPFNPLENRHLAESVVNALESQPEVPLGAIQRFDGAGVYLIYYKGQFYSDAVRLEAPIYVGKAERAHLTDAPVGPLLYTACATMYDQSSNLSIEDFTCRYLVVDEVFVPLAEWLLIERHHPLWNRDVSGFGINQPGRGRAGQQRSAWDTIHPGRDIAANLPSNKRESELIARFVQRRDDRD